MKTYKDYLTEGLLKSLGDWFDDKGRGAKLAAKAPPPKPEPKTNVKPLGTGRNFAKGSFADYAKGAPEIVPDVEAKPSSYPDVIRHFRNRGGLDISKNSGYKGNEASPKGGKKIRLAGMKNEETQEIVRNLVTEIMRQRMEDDKLVLESGLARIAHHMNSSGGLGIIASATGTDARKERHTEMIKRLRSHGYGPVVTTGKTKEWGPEASVLVPGIKPHHLKSIGDEFGQQAVIHAKHGKGTLHWLAAGGDKAGSSEEIGKAHYNTPNDVGVTVLKGLGWRPKDDRKPNRSLTFKEETEYVLEGLWVAPTGQLNPLWTKYK
jgi:hypothetical protein